VSSIRSLSVDVGDMAVFEQGNPADVVDASGVVLGNRRGIRLPVVRIE
jgi:hypothetical protein